MNTDVFAQKAFDRLAKEGPLALTESERTVAAVWGWMASVSNSGFSGYYLSGRADFAAAAPGALAEIGAVRLAEIARQANAVFGSKGPSANRAVRREQLKALTAAEREKFAALELRCRDCDEDVDELLEQYLMQPAGLR